MLRNKKNGFTLIEMMVAVSIFSIIALIVSSVFITVTYSYQKARDLGRLADNINFAMDHMTYNLKISTEHSCEENEKIGATVKFGSREGQRIEYSLEEAEDCLLFTEAGDGYCLTEVDSIFVSNFFCELLEGGIRNGLKINLQGRVVSSFGDTYEFDLQTFVADRLGG